MLFILDLLDYAEVTGFLTGAQQVALLLLVPAFCSFTHMVRSSTSGPLEAHPLAIPPVEGSPQPCSLQMTEGPAVSLLYMPPAQQICDAGSTVVNLEKWLLAKFWSLLRPYHLWGSCIYVWEALATLCGM